MPQHGASRTLVSPLSRWNALRVLQASNAPTGAFNETSNDDGTQWMRDDDNGNWTSTDDGNNWTFSNDDGTNWTRFDDDGGNWTLDDDGYAGPDGIELVCSDDGRFVLDDDFHGTAFGTTCSYCENYHMWDTVVVPATITDPVAMEAYRKDAWSRSETRLDAPLFNYSCSNQCLTCITTSTDSFCGYFDSKDYFLYSPLNTTEAMSDAATTDVVVVNSTGEFVTPVAVDILSLLFADASEFCFTYDTDHSTNGTTTNATGHVCFGFASVENASDPTSMGDYVCHMAYNNVRCNSCDFALVTSVEGGTRQCLTVDCANLDAIQLASSPINSCTDSDQFVGPLRWAQILSGTNTTVTPHCNLTRPVAAPNDGRATVTTPDGPTTSAAESTHVMVSRALVLWFALFATW